MAQNEYSENGVAISKASIAIGDEVTLTYKGYLVSNGAENIYAHLGYGDSWEEKCFVPMQKEENGTYNAKIKVTQTGILNVCFKDAGDAWDNNWYKNYCFEVNNKKIASKPTSTKATEEKNLDSAITQTKVAKVPKTTKVVKATKATGEVEAAQAVKAPKSRAKSETAKVKKETSTK